jgi:hypothetical protein
MKLRYSLGNIDLVKDDPRTVDLSHLPEWLQEDAREILCRMDYANKATGQMINAKSIDVEVDIDSADLWKHTDLGDYELVDEQPEQDD